MQVLSDFEVHIACKNIVFFTFYWFAYHSFIQSKLQACLAEVRGNVKYLHIYSLLEMSLLLTSKLLHNKQLHDKYWSKTASLI